MLVTLGLFRFVINACLLYFVGMLMKPHFYVGTFWDAFWGAIIISLVIWILSSLFLTSDGKIHAITHHPAMKKAVARTLD